MNVRFHLFFFFLAFFFTKNLYAEQQLVFSTIANSLNAQISERIMVKAYERLGYQIDILPMPAKRSLMTSNSGEIDGELFRLAGIDKKWTNLVPVPIAINHMEGMVISRTLDLDINGWDSLAPFRIGIRRGIRFSENGTEGMDRTLVDSNENLFKLLDYGRVDLIVMTRLNWLQENQSRQYPSLRLLEPAVQSYPLYHYVHTKNAHLVPLIQKVLADMAKKDEFAQLKQAVLQDYL